MISMFEAMNLHSQSIPFWNSEFLSVNQVQTLSYGIASWHKKLSKIFPLRLTTGLESLPTQSSVHPIIRLFHISGSQSSLVTSLYPVDFSISTSDKYP
jgi:hypothetical protein